uniref:Uncharacterized protein n=1 Tax=Rangifer tarandus platyrhynchus TaxID=3082113 RepID=A0ACB0ETP7_RANTA|nr:unnamed protein product [Rangifer tarandus platyrhynchus]
MEGQERAVKPGFKLRKELALVPFEQKECMKETGQRQGPRVYRTGRAAPAEAGGRAQQRQQQSLWDLGASCVEPGGQQGQRDRGTGGDRTEDPCGELSALTHELPGETLWGLPRVLGEGVPVEAGLLGAEAPSHR